MENIRIELSNGFATIKPILTRKSSKMYKKMAFANSTVNEKGKTIINMGDSLDATDVLVLNQVVELNIDGKDVPVDSDNFDAMDSRDYDLISNAVLALMNGKDEEKKS